MHQIKKLTEKEQIEVYMKLSKEEIVKLLMESHRLLDEFTQSFNLNSYIFDEEIHKMD